MGQTNNLLIWIPLLPILGAMFNLLAGRNMSRKTVQTVAVGSVAAACLISIIVVAGPLWQEFQLSQEGRSNGVVSQHVYTWIEVGQLKIDFALHLDTLSAVMILVVTFVGTLIHIYSTGYMSQEPRYAAYFGYLNLFTGAMLILVLGSSLPVMFIGWEGVGLCSFLLIGFWYEKTEYANAGRKAFVVNRIGDFAFLLGMFVLYWGFRNQVTSDPISLDWLSMKSEGAIKLFESSYNSVRGAEPGGFFDERYAFFAAFLLFIGACGKSAQIPLYVWLPDAMAGPTPVSALIHAATMVTAGVYMVARLSFLYMSSATAMAIVCGVGALTALFAAFMAFAQTDLKKVLAYSTVSQLGFMFVAVGSGAYVAGVFHLMTHAFFKAGLFLGAGSIMHAMSGSGDITKMGGLRKKLPITHATFLIYCIAIAGLPPFAGFFSKDEILAGAFGASGAGWIPGYGYILFGILTLAAFGTAIYMFRLYFVVFSGECRADEETKSHIHESPASMTMPLVILAGLAVVAGFIGLPHVGGLPNYLGEWLYPSLELLGSGKRSLLADYPAHHLSESTILILMAAATAVAVAAVLLAAKLYAGKRSPLVDRFTAGKGAKLYDLSKNKLYVDEAYSTIFIRPFRNVAVFLFKYIDRFVIDTVFVGGTALIVDVGGRIVGWFQNGKIHRYVSVMLIGLAVILFVSWRADSPSLRYDAKPSGEVTIEVLPGFGPDSRHVTILWDFDEDGVADIDTSGDKLTGTKQTRWLDPYVKHTVSVWAKEAKTGETHKSSIVIPARKGGE